MFQSSDSTYILLSFTEFILLTLSSDTDKVLKNLYFKSEILHE
jgi:hypothetical protein